MSRILPVCPSCGKNTLSIFCDNVEGAMKFWVACSDCKWNADATKTGRFDSPSDAIGGLR